MDINRGLIVVRPRQPYVDWANNCGDSPTKITLTDVRADANVYLVPCWEDDIEFDLILRKVYRSIFENELSGWTKDRNTWPKQRGFKSFLKWFEVERHSMVFDLGDGVIKVEGN
jgi:hypothetical protein